MLKDSHLVQHCTGHNMQQWRKLLCSSSNKASLIKYLVEEWKVPKHRERHEICEETHFRITRLQREKVSDLTSTQEEAHNQTLLHALHAAHAGYNAVVITTDDTDVLILCLGLIFLVPYMNTEPHTVLCCWQGGQSSWT